MREKCCFKYARCVCVRVFREIIDNVISRQKRHFSQKCEKRTIEAYCEKRQKGTLREIAKNRINRRLSLSLRLSLNGGKGRKRHFSRKSTFLQIATKGTFDHFSHFTLNSTNQNAKKAVKKKQKQPINDNASSGINRVCRSVGRSMIGSVCV